ncbi:MAG TPA: anthrone oxygenase family protein [Fimbriimonadaceae bacterium]|nr:anthrone oxygenase family protein [Fimbriimonadaceae bacterium]
MTLLDMLRRTALALAISFAAGLLFVNVYNSVVDAASWGSNFPSSIEAMRSYFKDSNPSDFFRIASPLNQAIALAALILCWKASPRIRLLCGIALLLAIGGDMLTFGYFYPRNAILMHGSVTDQLDTIRQAQAQWAAMNWVRSAGVALNLAFDFAALFALSGPLNRRMAAGPLPA